VSQIQEATSTPAAPYLHDGAVLQASDLSTVMVHPVWNDGSTNITFFQDYGNSMTYMAETIGHGDAPLSSYYAPLPGPGKYVMLEYQNDGGNFGCNGISVAQCVQDPHFIARTDFEITDTLLPNDTIATTTATTTS
jgi:hypothetical protein